ncbi:MAG: type II toxin-antitoxin system antitoxin SocA domain-containing protein [Methylomonas sp.]|jgi:uncharacterized phage-associated protein
MTHSALSVANAFLDLARAEGKGISPMKLQKLVYYAHGWYLGLFDNPLIDEAIEAWKYGPVIQSIYHEFKRFGSSDITVFGTEFDCDAGDFIEPRPEGDELARTLINKIWSEYGCYTAAALSSMTHVSGGPWEASRRDHEQARSVTIKNDLIKDYFKKLSTSQE